MKYLISLINTDFFSSTLQILKIKSWEWQHLHSVWTIVASSFQNYSKKKKHSFTLFLFPKVKLNTLATTTKKKTENNKKSSNNSSLLRIFSSSPSFFSIWNNIIDTYFAFVVHFLYSFPTWTFQTLPLYLCLFWHILHYLDFTTDLA